MSKVVYLRCCGLWGYSCMLFSLLNSNLERETFYLLVYFLFMIAWCCSATCGGDVVFRVVLTGRFASALCELSPNLQTCMCPQGADVQSATTTARLDVDVGAVLTLLAAMLILTRLAARFVKIYKSGYRLWNRCTLWVVIFHPLCDKWVVICWVAVLDDHD